MDSSKASIHFLLPIAESTFNNYCEENQQIIDTYNFWKEKIEELKYRLDYSYKLFVVKNRDEKTLGELFCFFILETIMIGKALKINPFNQPEVELIKKETYKILKG